MKLFSLFLLCLLANNINSFMESDRKCGDKLTQIMWILCENGFNTMMQKRSGGSHADISAIESHLPYVYDSASLLNIFQVDGNNFLAKTRRMRMAGIADECCRKSCTLNELSAYCI